MADKHLKSHSDVLIIMTGWNAAPCWKQRESNWLKSLSKLHRTSSDNNIYDDIVPQVQGFHNLFWVRWSIQSPTLINWSRDRQTVKTHTKQGLFLIVKDPSFVGQVVESQVLQRLGETPFSHSMNYNWRKLARVLHCVIPHHLYLVLLSYDSSRIELGSE